RRRGAHPAVSPRRPRLDGRRRTLAGRGSPAPKTRRRRLKPVVRRLRITPASVILFVVILGVGLIARNVLRRLPRVLGWLVAGAMVAAFPHPFVSALSRWMPRDVALLVVVVVALVSVGGLAYATVDDVSREGTKLREAAPAAARSIEQSERFGE